MILFKQHKTEVEKKHTIATVQKKNSNICVWVFRLIEKFFNIERFLTIGQMYKTWPHPPTCSILETIALVLP